MLIIATDIVPEHVYTFQVSMLLPDIPAAEVSPDILLASLRRGDYAQAERTIVGSLRQRPDVDTTEPTCLVINITQAGIAFMPFRIEQRIEAATGSVH